MKIKITENDVQAFNYMSCCFRMPLEDTAENMASVFGSFINWSSHKKIKRTTLAEV